MQPQFNPLILPACVLHTHRYRTILLATCVTLYSYQGMLSSFRRSLSRWACNSLLSSICSSLFQTRLMDCLFITDDLKSVNFFAGGDAGGELALIVSQEVYETKVVHLALARCRNYVHQLPSAVWGGMIADTANIKPAGRNKQGVVICWRHWRYGRSQRHAVARVYFVERHTLRHELGKGRRLHTYCLSLGLTQCYTSLKAFAVPHPSSRNSNTSIKKSRIHPFQRISISITS
jgi:hypothetical protein